MLSKIKTTVGFRSLSKLYIIFNLCLKIEGSSPSYTTGKLWVKKVGYYCLSKEKQQANDWILIVDESIGIGQEKLLVVLGVRQSQIDFTRPLTLQDMSPIYLQSKKTWNGEMVSEVLEVCKKRVGNVIYATTDGGSALKKGLRLSELTHIYDITHAIAVMLEKIYKDDIDFKEYTNSMGLFRAKLSCSQYTHLIPPNQRKKSRFLNIDIISKWGMNILKAFESSLLSEKEKELFQWVENKRDFIEEMNSIICTITELSILLKNKGLSRSTKRKCKKILKALPSTPRQQIFNEMFNEYLTTNSLYLDRKKTKILCTSDIIETTFGKYKNELSKNQMTGVTDLALIIPALTSDLSDNEIREAIDASTKEDIKKWGKENLCESLWEKRIEVFNYKNVG